MKKILLSISIIAISFSVFAVSSSPTQAAELSSKLKGRILLAVESGGEAWYVSPANLQRYYLGDPSKAFYLMRELGLGISNKDYNTFQTKAPARLAGRILLKVQDDGQAYYVNPLDLKLYYMGKPGDALGLMRRFGLGISNANLSQIPTSAKNTVPTIEVSNFDNLTIGMIDSTIDGWVVIHKEVNNQPSSIVGHAKIKTGKNYNVIVALDGITQSQNLIAMIYYNKGDLNKFEYPGTDVPLTFEGKNVIKKFFYTYTVSID